MLAACTAAGGPTESGGPASGGDREGSSDLALAEMHSPADRTLHLLVMETSCASGRPADGRIVVDDVTLTDREVRLRISITPPDGTQDCQGNPWTPFTVDLDAPLGDRAIVDASVEPPAELGQVDREATGDRRVEEAIDLALQWQPPGSYVLDAEAMCTCPGTRYRVTVRDGDVISRGLADGGTPDPFQVEPQVAPSLQEMLDRIRAAPEEVADLVVEDDGQLRYVSFDPMPNAEDDEISFSVEDLKAGSSP